MISIVSEESWNTLRQALSANSHDREILHTEAEKLRHQKLPTVVDKKTPAASGDFHDYVSLAPYWWPDPAKPAGLPYIRRDGELNPESTASDRGTLDRFCDAFGGSALAAIGLDSGPDAEHAGKLLRAWFIDEETRMKPHLRYGQAIPGRCDGRGIGLIDTSFFVPVLDLAHKLPFNPFWTVADLTSLRGWFDAYLTWLLESEFGRQECAEHNNHGTWYDTQVVWFSLLCGRPEIAARHLENHTLPRLATQIAEDGSQPHELARTLSLSYSTFNLIAFALLARAGGVSLEPKLSQAVRWMLPYFTGAKPWTWEQIKPFNAGAAVYLLELISQTTGSAEFIEARDSLAQQPWHRVALWRSSVRKD